MKEEDNAFLGARAFFRLRTASHIMEGECVSS